MENDLGEPEVIVNFTGIGQQKMLEATDANRGKPLAILVDGKVVIAPTIRFRIGSRRQLMGNSLLRRSRSHCTKPCIPQLTLRRRPSSSALRLSYIPLTQESFDEPTAFLGRRKRRRGR